jgi:hypothetical protein
MMFVADDLGAWLVGQLADAGRRRLITQVLGNEQERALRQAATAAVQFTAAEFRPGREEAEELAMVVSQVFSEPVPVASLSAQATFLEALHAAVAGQLAPLGDPHMTGTGKSSAEVLGVPVTVLAETLTSHLVQEIVARAAQGGPLTPLAAQLNHDVTHLQGQRLEAMFARLGDTIVEALARPPPATARSITRELTEAYGKCRGWIDSPTDGDAIGTRIAVHGGVRDVPDGHRLWIAHSVDPGRLLWPKDVEITLDKKGHFDVDVYEGGSSPRLYLALLLVSDSLSSDFDRWINEGSRSGHYPGLRLSPDSYVELARVSLRRNPSQAT